MHAQIIVAVAAGVRVGLLNSFVSIWRCAGVPPPHHLAIPGVGWRGTSAGMRLLWTNLRLRKMRRRWWEIVQCVGCDRTSVLRDLAHDVGVDAKALDKSQWLIPFTYRDLPVLSMHAREFEFPHQPLAHVRYVGPMTLASRPDRPLSSGDRTRLDALLARRSGSGRRRLIYAAFGSAFSADPAFLLRLAQAVEQRPHWDLVLSLGGRTAPAGVVLPPCVHAFEWLPQLEVLAHADAAISHGGINSIDECVAAGVPVLIAPGGETDMNGTTSRAIYHGIALTVDRRDDAVAIAGKLDRLLVEPAFRDRLRRLQESYAAYREHRIAEHAVDALLSAEPGPRRGAL
jgi:UDP:flavonoid glycosyltransferase YjiC (YdhE family)